MSQNTKPIRIGTRGSNLALYQANAVKDALTKLDPGRKIEIRIIKTKGDKILDKPLAEIGDKGLFTVELENELFQGGIDMAVHSLKDLPTLMPSGLRVSAVLPRGEFRDALISRDGRKLSEFSGSEVFATSSLRRRAGLKYINPTFHIVDIRGNVETRLRKLSEGHCDAIIMAAAGLQRLGLEDRIAEIIDPGIIIPAVSQGTIAIETLSDVPAIHELLSQINHTPTWNAVQAERAFLHNLQGGCQVPVGCYTEASGGSMTITGFVASLDGQTMIRDSETGSAGEHEALGIRLAEKLRARGADEILAEIRNKTKN